MSNLPDAIDAAFTTAFLTTVDGDSSLADIVQDASGNIRRLAEAVTPTAAGASDATGGHVQSLTEAVMGMTAALVQIAEAIGRVADAIEEHNTDDQA